VERKDGGRPGAVERAVVEHATTVRVQQHGCDAARHNNVVAVRGRDGMGADAAGKLEEKKSESGVFRIFSATWCHSVGSLSRCRGPPLAASDGFLLDQTPDPSIPECY
jgi:hypothetical protein